MIVRLQECSSYHLRLTFAALSLLKNYTTTASTRLNSQATRVGGGSEMTSRRQSSQLLLFLYLLTSLMVNARPFNEQDDVEMVAPFNSDASEIADTAACPAECTCSTGALSDLVVQCRSYQGLHANSLLPRLANQMEGFVTRLDIDGSQIPVLIEDFLNNDRGYVKSLRSLRLTNSAPNLEINDLDISQCNIATLPRNAFNRLYDLTSLNLSHNALTNLHFPLVLRKLQNLDLSHNRLSGTLNANLLGSCNELETLRLSWNQGLRLPDDGLQGDLSLEKLPDRIFGLW
ncbi:hypothetical protein B566_EDAN006063 [Ephemera danica]|nr:hypothetical protein B566_EDAN006063 [Ephemera danica]